MIGNLIQEQFFAGQNWPFGAALTMLLMLFLLVCMFFYLRSTARGRARGGDRVNGLRPRRASCAVYTAAVLRLLFLPILLVVVFSFNNQQSLHRLHGLLVRVVPRASSRTSR